MYVYVCVLTGEQTLKLRERFKPPNTGCEKYIRIGMLMMSHTNFL